MGHHSKRGFLSRLHIPYVKEKPEDKEWAVVEKPMCVECKQQEARYWSDSFCESCMVEILKEEN